MNKLNKFIEKQRKKFSIKTASNALKLIILSLVCSLCVTFLGAQEAQEKEQAAAADTPEDDPFIEKGELFQLRRFEEN